VRSARLGQAGKVRQSITTALLRAGTPDAPLWAVSAPFFLKPPIDGEAPRQHDRDQGIGEKSLGQLGQWPLATTESEPRETLNVAY
jgi:hypothetical protein